MILDAEDVNKFHCDKCINFSIENTATLTGMYAACVFNMVISDYDKCPYFEGKEAKNET